MCVLSVCVCVYTLLRCCLLPFVLQRSTYGATLVRRHVSATHTASLHQVACSYKQRIDRIIKDWIQTADWPNHWANYTRAAYVIPDVKVYMYLDSSHLKKLYEGAVIHHTTVRKEQIQKELCL